MRHSRCSQLIVARDVLVLLLIAATAGFCTLAAASAEEESSPPASGHESGGRKWVFLRQQRERHVVDGDDDEKPLCVPLALVPTTSDSTREQVEPRPRPPLVLLPIFIQYSDNIVSMAENLVESIFTTFSGVKARGGGLDGGGKSESVDATLKRLRVSSGLRQCAKRKLLHEMRRDEKCSGPPPSHQEEQRDSTRQAGPRRAAPGGRGAMGDLDGSGLDGICIGMIKQQGEKKKKEAAAKVSTTADLRSGMYYHFLKKKLNTTQRIVRKLHDDFFSASESDGALQHGYQLASVVLFADSDAQFYPGWDHLLWALCMSPPRSSPLSSVSCVDDGPAQCNLHYKPMDKWCALSDKTTKKENKGDDGGGGRQEGGCPSSRQAPVRMWFQRETRDMINTGIVVVDYRSCGVVDAYDAAMENFRPAKGGDQTAMQRVVKHKLRPHQQNQEAPPSRGVQSTSCRVDGVPNFSPSSFSVATKDDDKMGADRTPKFPVHNVFRRDWVNAGVLGHQVESAVVHHAHMSGRYKRMNLLEGAALRRRVEAEQQHAPALVVLDVVGVVHSSCYLLHDGGSSATQSSPPTVGGSDSKEECLKSFYRKFSASGSGTGSRLREHYLLDVPRIVDALIHSGRRSHGQRSVPVAARHDDDVATEPTKKNLSTRFGGGGLRFLPSHQRQLKEKKKNREDDDDFSPPQSAGEKSNAGPFSSSSASTWQSIVTVLVCLVALVVVSKQFVLGGSS